MAGRAMNEPVAIVAHATTERQQVLETTLGEAAADLSASGLEPPAVIVVGEVVRLRAGLDWLGALAGRVLVADPLGLQSEARRDGETRMTQRAADRRRGGEPFRQDARSRSG